MPTRPTRRVASPARTAAVAVLLALGAVAPLAAPAQAETIFVPERDKDGMSGADLDVTSVRVDNNKHAVVVKIRFRRVSYGNLGVRIRTADGGERHEAGVLMARRWQGDRVRFYALAGRTVESRSCERLEATWDAERDTARVRVPAACLAGGDYDRVRVQVLTEVGSDADYVPEPREPNTWPYSRAVERGPETQDRPARRTRLSLRG